MVVAILKLYLSILVEELYIEIFIRIIPKFKRRNIWIFFITYSIVYSKTDHNLKM